MAERWEGRGRGRLGTWSLSEETGASGSSEDWQCWGVDDRSGSASGGGTSVRSVLTVLPFALQRSTAAAGW